MQIAVDGKPSRGLSATETIWVSVSRVAGDAVLEGVVLAADAASRRGARFTRFFFGALFAVVAALLVALLAGVVFGDVASDVYVVALAIVACTGGCALILRWGFRRTMRRWELRIAERVAALPLPGAAVRLDTLGVTLGDHSARWEALAVVGVDLASYGGEGDHGYLVERVLLADGARRFALDRNFMTNGPALVDAAFAKIIRDRGVTELKREAP